MIAAAEAAVEAGRTDLGALAWGGAKGRVLSWAVVGGDMVSYPELHTIIVTALTSTL